MATGSLGKIASWITGQVLYPDLANVSVVSWESVSTKTGGATVTLDTMIGCGTGEKLLRRNTYQCVPYILATPEIH